MRTWRLLKSESMILPREKALEFAAKHSGLPNSPVERQRNPNRTKQLIGKIHEDMLLPFTWATVEFGGVVYRMNGQHSSGAILDVAQETPDKIPGKISFHLDHYQADDREGMVQLFRQFDQRWSSRTSDDIAGAYQGLADEIAGCNRSAMKNAVGGIAWYLKTVEGAEGVPSGDNVFSMMHRGPYMPFLVWFNGIFNSRRELLQKQVIAAIYKTYETSQSAATDFWRDVSFGRDYFTDDMKPGAVLIDELTKTFEDKDWREKEGYGEASTYYKKSIKAWNASILGQRISSLKVSKGKGWPNVLSPGDDAAEAA